MAGGVVEAGSPQGRHRMRLHVDESATPWIATRPRTSSDGGNWTRQLEQAQTWNWFHGALAKPPPAVTPWQTRQSSEDVLASRAALLLPSYDPAPVRGTTSAPVHQARVADASIIPTGSVAHGSGHAVGVANADCKAPAMDVADPTSESGEPQRAANAHAPEASDDPVRVHVESGQGEVAVWLGIDGTPDFIAARAAALLSELRHELASTGRRLAVFVCNGKPVDPLTPPHYKELP
jgi:hypothetical protein